ncbi:carboxymuconolactone decarboxylase family protein [Pseudomonas sp. UL073]|uniref:Carboxymuconolactone decarboxylase family protein n=1 Tax=Zestomonas insulae TaxID=2809017 RepID=A0ABS2IEF9_9GAMM|nr:carboxymuconolactone decarboxylase family protein [Pseudomonas insulae]MBM7060674.1 carboxymuconolactone decarboxylase family protein [Pseudomonas insulae]
MSLTIALPDDQELPKETAALLKQLPQANIFRMLANAPTSLPGFVQLATSILMGSQFDARKREIAILRIGKVTHSSYEWEQHVLIAQRVGVTADEIAQIGVDGPVTGLDEEGRFLCRVAEEISLNVRLSDEALALLLERYGRRQATELILCCSYFNMVSRFLESTRVELDADLKKLHADNNGQLTR